MKKLTAACFLLLIAGALVAQAQEEDAAFYYELFKYSTDFGDKAAFLSAMAQTNDESAVTDFDDALNSLLKVDRKTLTMAQAEDYDWAVRVTAVSLGRYAYAPAAGNLMKVFRSTDDALVRAEAAISLGYIKATEYAPEIASFLETLNLSPPSDPDAGEKLAYGCIVCLGNMREPLGWRPVFFASQAWYSKRIRDEAENSLKMILADPVTEVMSIIQGNFDASVKLAALKFYFTVSSDKDKRVNAAREAYRQAAGTGASTLTQKQSLLDLRQTALNILISLGDRASDMVAILNKAWETAAFDERILIITFLSVNGSDQALGMLERLILAANSARESGVAGDDTDRMAKALAQAAGRTKSAKLADALQKMIDNKQWPSSVTLAAQDALAAVKGR